MSAADVFNAVPVWLRKFIGYGISAGIAFACVVFAFLSFGPLTTYIKDKLNIIDKQDVKRVSESVQYASEDQMNAAIDLTARRLVEDSRERIRLENDSLFQVVSVDLIEPGIKRLRSLEENVKRLNSMMGMSNDLLTQQRDQSRIANDRLGELQQQLNGSELGQKLDQIMLEMQRQREDIEVIKKIRNTKQKF